MITPTNTAANLASGYGTFIRHAAEELATAIFTDCGERYLKLPSAIVHILEADDFGHIYFTVHRPYKDISGLASSFDASLQFYNRAHAYRMNVHGRTTILPSDFAPDCVQPECEDLLLRMEVQGVEYWSGPGTEPLSLPSDKTDSITEIKKAWHYLQRLTWPVWKGRRGTWAH